MSRPRLHARIGPGDHRPVDPVFAVGLVVAYVLLVLALCGLAAVLVRVAWVEPSDTYIRPVPLPTMTVVPPGATVPVMVDGDRWAVSIESERVVMAGALCGW